MAKLKVSVNKNPTKEGIKVQFVLPQTLEGDVKTEATQKLQSKLNQGLSQYNLTVSQDTDVPYSNVIGFLIPIADFKLLIKNAMGGGAQTEPAPEAAPAPEEKLQEYNSYTTAAWVARGGVKQRYGTSRTGSDTSKTGNDNINSPDEPKKDNTINNFYNKLESLVDKLKSEEVKVVTDILKKQPDQSVNTLKKTSELKELGISPSKTFIFNYTKNKSTPNSDYYLEIDSPINRFKRQIEIGKQYSLDKKDLEYAISTNKESFSKIQSFLEKTSKMSGEYGKTIQEIQNLLNPSQPNKPEEKTSQPNKPEEKTSQPNKPEEKKGFFSRLFKENEEIKRMQELAGIKK